MALRVAFQLLNHTEYFAGIFTLALLASHIENTFELLPIVYVIGHVVASNARFAPGT